MIFKKEKWSDYRKRVEAYHDWYAWHPVFGDGFIVWLDVVQRKREWSWCEGYWVYRLKETPND